MELRMYKVPRGIPYFALDCFEAFTLLSKREKNYLYHFSRASWAGLGIVASQVSSESKDILNFVYKCFKANPPATVRALVSQNRHANSANNNINNNSAITEDAITDFIGYCGSVYSNAGNYSGFGDRKFIPSVEKDKFLALVRALPHNSKELSEELEKIIEVIYDVGNEKRYVLSLGFPPKNGTTAYYSSDIVEEDIRTIDAVLTANGVLRNRKDSSKLISMCLDNTRTFKIASNFYEIRIASVIVEAEPHLIFIDKAAKKLIKIAPENDETTHPKMESNVLKVRVQYGDHHEAMKAVVEELKKAKNYAANDIQTQMLDCYITSFTNGDVEEHKESQRFWVKDKGPAVETNIGFIENYRDPAGVRAEFEGFVACVNKAETEKYANLVSHGEKFLARLPWGEYFEKDKFLSPDFTSLEVFSFTTSGVPLGINIPNYDDVRQTFGFKNVYLSNVGHAFNANDRPNHLTESDWELWKTYFVPSMTVNVALHELLGHGSGKLLMENKDGKFNFDKENLKNPYAKAGEGSLITSWYKPGDTWSSRFGAFSNSMEECRAEAVSLYLNLYEDICKVLVPSDFNAEDCVKVSYIGWLSMVRAGLIGLEMYTPEAKKWGQAHMRARFCILQFFLRAGQVDDVTKIADMKSSEFYSCSQITGINNRSIVQIKHDPSVPLLEISVDAKRIATDGKAAIGELLRRLNIYKAMADSENGICFFEELTAVSDEFLKIRETIINMRKPRREFVQAHMKLTGEEDVQIIPFDASVDGALNALVARHTDIPLL